MPVLPAVTDQVQQGHDLLIAVGVRPAFALKTFQIPGCSPDPVGLAQQAGIQVSFISPQSQLVRKGLLVIGQKARLCLLRLNGVIVSPCHKIPLSSDFLSDGDVRRFLLGKLYHAGAKNARKA